MMQSSSRVVRAFGARSAIGNPQSASVGALAQRVQNREASFPAPQSPSTGATPKIPTSDTENQESTSPLGEPAPHQATSCNNLR